MAIIIFVTSQSYNIISKVPERIAKSDELTEEFLKHNFASFWDNSEKTQWLVLQKVPGSPDEINNFHVADEDQNEPIPCLSLD